MDSASVEEKPRDQALGKNRFSSLRRGILYRWTAKFGCGGGGGGGGVVFHFKKKKK
jgi:hypothetical protein